MSYYEILGVNKNSSNKEIRRAYARRLRQYNVETNKDEYIAILEAYEVLGDATKRKEYDDYIQEEFLELNYKLREEAGRCLRNREFAAGVKIFKKLSMLEPENQSNLYLLIQCYCGINNFTNAEKMLRRIVKSDLYTDVSFVLEVINSIIDLSNYYLVNECINVLKIKVEPLINRIEDETEEVLDNFEIILSKIRRAGVHYNCSLNAV